MPNNQQPGKNVAGTDVQKVKQQNAQSASAAGQFGAEFASETNAQEVKQQNAQSAAKKSQNSGQQQS